MVTGVAHLGASLGASLGVSVRRCRAAAAGALRHDGGRYAAVEPAARRAAARQVGICSQDQH